MTTERAFLTAILERPDDNASKLVYADWLEEQGDPRGEFLRLMIKVRKERVVTPEPRQRHQDLSAELADLRTKVWDAWRAERGSFGQSRELERRMQQLAGQLANLSKQLRQPIPTRLQQLAATFDPNWLAVVGDPAIEGCGKSTREGWPLRFDFVCDKTWADMKPTGDNKVRHCESCNKRVHFCDNLADAREHSREGHCIAIDVGIVRRDGDLVPRMAVLGRPSTADVRKTYQEDLDPVSQARLDARKQAKENPERLSILAKLSKLPGQRIRLVPNADASTIQSIHRGVLFLMAFWSGSARQAFVKLTETLDSVDGKASSSSSQTLTTRRKSTKPRSSLARFMATAKPPRCVRVGLWPPRDWARTRPALCRTHWPFSHCLDFRKSPSNIGEPP
jgi:uncharacterized protein (TIGR02996 family)